MVLTIFSNHRDEVTLLEINGEKQLRKSGDGHVTVGPQLKKLITLKCLQLMFLRY